jgi:hypothetical protein
MVGVRVRGRDTRQSERECSITGGMRQSDKKTKQEKTRKVENTIDKK